MTHFKMIGIVLPLLLAACASSGLEQRNYSKDKMSQRMNGKTPERMSGPIAAIKPAGLLIANFNRNNDYSIDQEEYLAGVAQAFQNADNNLDGRLSPFELAHWRKNALGSEDVAPGSMYFDADFNQVVTKAEFDTAFSKLFSTLEKNGDGVISFDELMRVVIPPKRGSQNQKRRSSEGKGKGGQRGGQRPGGF